MVIGAPRSICFGRGPPRTSLPWRSPVQCRQVLLHADMQGLGEVAQTWGPVVALKPRIVICLEFADMGADGSRGGLGAAPDRMEGPPSPPSSSMDAPGSDDDHAQASSLPSSSALSSPSSSTDDPPTAGMAAGLTPSIFGVLTISAGNLTHTPSGLQSPPSPQQQQLGDLAPPSPSSSSYRFIPKETRSLVKQVELSMVANRQAGSPMELHATSWLLGGDLDHFSKFLNGSAWPIVRHEGELQDCFPLDQVVMLSPDVSDPLTHLEDGKVYAIGGIVDRSVRKGVTTCWSSRAGVTVKRLPIQENKELLGMGEGTSRSPVLNISDVVQALVQFKINGGDWGKALALAIPLRKTRATVPRVKKARGSSTGGHIEAAISAESDELTEESSEGEVL